MDYGYQLLRHVVQQVFGNLGAAARITIAPVLIGYVICGLIVYVLAGEDFFTVLSMSEQTEPIDMPFGSEAEAVGFVRRVIGAFILCAPVLLFTYAWAAVGWHRYVLLEEYPSGFAANWSGPAIKSYVWAAIRLTLLLMAVGFAIVLVLGLLVLPQIESVGVLTFLNFGLTVGFTWAGARLGLVLPSSAIGQYMRLGESWEYTKPAASAILLPILIIPLAFFVVNVLVGMIPVIWVILLALSIWIQMLINLALLTTLYGNLVEGRQLN